MTHPTAPDLAGSLLSPCEALSRRDQLGLNDLRALVEGIDLSPAERALLALPDPDRPYGRRVILATPMLEVMVATWTRGQPCAPHDHGGAVGAVKVLQGRAHHQVWGIEGDDLAERRSHAVLPGDVLACGPDLIHSMADDGADQPLMTLHVYTASIDHMVVYEPEARRTHVVEGSCGAWVPHDQPGLIRFSRDGTLRRAALLPA